MLTEKEVIQEWGFAKTEGLPHIVNILNIIGNEYIIEDNILVYPDYLKPKIDEEQAKLKKSFASFKNNKFNKAIPRSAYKEKKLDISVLRKRHGDRWRTYNWVKEMVGIYETWCDGYEFYWNLIGNDWKRDNNGDVFLSESVGKEILQDQFFGQGRDFLKAKFWSRSLSRQIFGFYK